MSQDIATMPEASLLSVVVPLYDEQENLPELYRRLVVALEAEGIPFELVFVDDASRDCTPHLLAELHHQDPRLVVISLSRNFGHQAAICAGIDQARGQVVILMDGDLQDPPEMLGQFIAAWRAGHDVVFAVRTKRKEGFFKRCCYELFYRVFHIVSDLKIPRDSGDFCLMDRKVVDALKNLPERNRFVRGLRTFVGFKQMGLTYDRPARQAGQAKYTFRALCRLALDGLIGFSGAPLSLLTYGGACCLGLALLGGLVSFVWGVLHGTAAGWWIVALVVFGCTGMQLLGLGIIGEYIRRIFLETKARPTYIIGAIKQSCPEARSQQAPSQPKAA
jgi:dolichol-phosphate mannosyltransferase